MLFGDSINGSFGIRDLVEGDIYPDVFQNIGDLAEHGVDVLKAL